MSMTEKSRIAVLASPGTNRDLATKAAIEKASGMAEIVPIGTLIETPTKLYVYQGLIIPGGFSHGDDIQSGVVLAIRMQQLKAELEEFAFHYQRPIVGVCNGFQALVQSGLLPFGEMTPRHRLVATLTQNDSGRFESRWIFLTPQESVNRYISSGTPMTLPVDHGEGKFIATMEIINQLETDGQVVYRYTTAEGEPERSYPDNPNGSVHAIAGITDPTGVILGMMPHPEDFVRPEHQPNWRRKNFLEKPDGLIFFEQIVQYAKDI